MTTKSKNSHGGVRSGAGAKPKKEKLLTRAYCLTSAQVRRIEKEAKSQGTSNSEALRAILG